MQRQAPGTPAAVVIWLDYDPPAGINADAARSDRALAGAPRLASFVDSLSRSATVSVVCHSYGSVVCAHAAPRLRIASLVVVGSPGMDVRTGAALHTTATVWAGIAPDDPIGVVPHTRVEGFGHAADPTATAFGARALPVDGAHGHNGYLVAGTGFTARDRADRDRPGRDRSCTGPVGRGGPPVLIRRRGRPPR